jgi:hypothetical protein
LQPPGRNLQNHAQIAGSFPSMACLQIFAGSRIKTLQISCGAATLFPVTALRHRRDLP